MRIDIKGRLAQLCDTSPLSEHGYVGGNVGSERPLPLFPTRRKSAIFPPIVRLKFQNIVEGRINQGANIETDSQDFTRERSKVRSLVCVDLHIQSLIGPIPLESAPKKLGHDRGTVLDQGRQQSFRRAHEALRFRCQ